MPKRKIDGHHYGLPAIWGLQNAIRMPLWEQSWPESGLPAISRELSLEKILGFLTISENPVERFHH